MRIGLLVAALAVGLGVSVLVGCSRAEADAQRTVELRVWDWWSPTSNEDYSDYFYGSMKKRFEADHPNVRVTYQFVPFPMYVQKLTTACAGASPPDVFQCSVAWAQTFWERGVLMDLTDRVEQTPELGMDRFLEAAVRHNQLDGRIYGVPIILDAECLIYNLDMFEQAGLPTGPHAMANWADLRRFAQALTYTKDNGDKVYGFAFAGMGSGMTHFVPLLFADGGKYWSDPPYRAVFNCPETLEVVDFLRTLYYQDKVCPTFSPQLDAEADFCGGRVAMFVGGTWAGKNIDRNSGSYLGPDRPGGLRYAMTNFPAGPSSKTGKRTTMTWGNMMVIAKGAKHPEEAWEYVKLAGSLEGCLIRLKTLGMNAPRRDFYELTRDRMPPAWVERGYITWDEKVAAKPYLATVPEICNSGGKAPNIERLIVDHVFKNAYESVMLNEDLTEAQAKEAFDRAASQADKVYAIYRPR